jgi:hypothetical protein
MSEIQQCIGCKKEFAQVTLNKNKGICGKCKNKWQTKNNIKNQTIKKPSIKKPSIPKIVKTKVWDTYIGKEHGTSKCTCCKMNEITQSHFECGHVISTAMGGTIDHENLRPICSECNKSMGVHNMLEFIKKHKFDTPIIEQKNEENESIHNCMLCNVV